MKDFSEKLRKDIAELHDMISEITEPNFHMLGWALEKIGKHYSASALWMFQPLPTPRVFGMACAEQYKLSLKHDSYRPGLIGNP